MYKTILIFLILFSVISKSVSIINGNKTSIETYHWLASVVIADFFLPLSWYAEYTCAGTIIGSKWVITAAHCVPDIPWWSSSEYYIRVGSNDPERNGDMIKVDSINHEHYDPDTHGNDVALVKLASEIEWKYPTHPIEMVNEEYEIIHGLVVRTAGFGITCDDCKISSQLYELYHTTCIPITRLLTKDDEAKETIMCSEDVNGKSTGSYI